MPADEGAVDRAVARMKEVEPARTKALLVLKKANSRHESENTAMILLDDRIVSSHWNWESRKSSELIPTRHTEPVLVVSQPDAEPGGFTKQPTNHSSNSVFALAWPRIPARGACRIPTHEHWHRREYRPYKVYPRVYFKRYMVGIPAGAGTRGHVYRHAHACQYTWRVHLFPRADRFPARAGMPGRVCRHAAHAVFASANTALDYSTLR
jgi:hypothetical protein